MADHGSSERRGLAAFTVEVFSTAAREARRGRVAFELAEGRVVSAEAFEQWAANEQRTVSLEPVWTADALIVRCSTSPSVGTSRTHGQVSRRHMVMDNLVADRDHEKVRVAVAGGETSLSLREYKEWLDHFDLGVRDWTHADWRSSTDGWVLELTFRQLVPDPPPRRGFNVGLPSFLERFLPWASRRRPR
jgi:hypothetical protein